MHFMIPDRALTSPTPPATHADFLLMTCRDERGSTAVLAHAEDGRWTHGREDNDAAASLEVPIHDCKIATCMHADEIGGEHDF